MIFESLKALAASVKAGLILTITTVFFQLL